MKSLRIALLSLVFLVSHPALAAGAPERTIELPLSSARYELVLTYGEFVALHDAAQAGVGRYGGGADFNVRLVNTSLGAVWIVTCRDAEVVELLDYWMTERITSLVGTVDFRKSIADSTADVIETAKSARTKLKTVRGEPIWDPVELEGILASSDSTWSLVTDSGSVRLGVANCPGKPAGLVGRRVVVQGAVRRAGILDAIRVLEKRPNTIELFVMSLCPYAQKAEEALISDLSTRAGPSAPSLDIRYIFYLRRHGDGFTSMKGEDEVQESLVQIVLRDSYPRSFWPYLLARTRSTEPWTAIAAGVGLSDADVVAISERLAADRDSLIRAEFDEVAGIRGILDRSPTLIWEGRPVADLRQIPHFAESPPSLAIESCQSDTHESGPGAATTARAGQTHSDRR